ncbi:EAL domain-containing protein [Saccharopolyspora erythraea]|uniref:EAL domain-containing protein n=1 Tax=Saccharopolyspora erythraea TaxID=1836 RepID=UPI001BAE06AE|nr:EAL domain-containing protein [Saccharopolyspora erythraea]QUH03984.1 EAL domain-containing protein [Saccharopolyspora erythraea]
MSVPLDDVRFAYQPLVNVRIGGVVGVEALACPPSGDLDELFGRAERDGLLAEVDARLAANAVADFAGHGTLLPLHLNVLASTVADAPERMDAVRKALCDAGRLEHEVTLEISPPVSGLGERLVASVNALRDFGFRIALDRVGGGEVPLELVADLRPDVVKLDRRLVQLLPERLHRLTVLDSVRQVCEATSTRVVVQGVDRQEHLALLRHHGIALGQGNLLAPTTWRPPENSWTSSTWVDTGDPAVPVIETRSAAGPLVTDYITPATMLPIDVSTDEVRQTFTDGPEITCVVLVDADGRPQQTITRNRFLLGVAGPYGHALHVRKPAARLADEPRSVTTSTTALEALDLLTRSGHERLDGDAVVVDEAGRCLGIVPAEALIRGMAEFNVEEAASLNPLTRLPGSDSLAREVARRIDRGGEFTLSWLDVDDFQTVNEKFGFAAGDELIRGIGRVLGDAAAQLPSVRIAHPGRDDFLAVGQLEDLRTLARKVFDTPHEAGGMPVTVSLATLVCSPAIRSYAEASRRLAPLKRFVKNLRGDSWVLSRPGTEQIEILRGRNEDGNLPSDGGGAEADRQPSDEAGDSSGDGVAARPGQRPAELLAVGPVATGVFDEAERLVHANASLCALLGYELDQLRGMSTWDLAHPQDALGASRRPVAGAREQAVSQRMLVRSDGRPLHCELHSALSVQDDGSQFWVVAFQDVTRWHQLAEDLRHRATHDHLTGLPNRATAKEQLNDLLGKADPESVGVALCDVDNFKRVNDSLGHDAGDDLLVALARRLEAELPLSCTPAKLSGDEFLITCADVGGVGGIESLASIVSSLMRTSMPLHGQLVRVSASVGAAVPTRSATSADDLLRVVDAAMLQAKRRGPGRVSLAGPGRVTSADRQLRLEREFRDALHGDRLGLHYEPILKRDGTLVAVEALVRWHHPDRGLLTPEVFLPAAEQGDLLRDLDSWVLSTALREAGSWREQGDCAAGIAVDLFGLAPDRPEFVENVAAIIDGSSISDHRVVLEVAETSLLDLQSPARSALARLAESGVRFAVDDFGGGYSSPARLKDLPARIVKIDSSLVAAVSTDVSSRAVTQAIVTVAHATGRSCVAQGVETEAQFRVLGELGVDAYQGGLLSPPLAPHELRTVVERGSLPVPNPSYRG